MRTIKLKVNEEIRIVLLNKEEVILKPTVGNGLELKSKTNLYAETGESVYACKIGEGKSVNITKTSEL